MPDDTSESNASVNTADEERKLSLLKSYQGLVLKKDPYGRVTGVEITKALHCRDFYDVNKGKRKGKENVQEKIVIEYFSVLHNAFVPFVGPVSLQDFGQRLILKVTLAPMPAILPEKRVGDVIGLVHKWREVAAGRVCNINGALAEYAFTEAASKLGFSKPMLDDYFLQLKKARKYGISIGEMGEDRIGTLRRMIKKEKAENNQQPKKKISADCQLKP